MAARHLCSGVSPPMFSLNAVDREKAFLNLSNVVSLSRLVIAGCAGACSFFFSFSFVERLSFQGLVKGDNKSCSFSSTKELPNL